MFTKTRKKRFKGLYVSFILIQFILFSKVDKIHHKKRAKVKVGVLYVNGNKAI